MTYLLLLVAMVSCCNNSSTTKDEKRLPTTQKVAEVDHTNSYVISKYSDDDAICYVIHKLEAISISCVPKIK